MNDDEQKEHKGKIKGTNLEIIPTPGHSNDGCSLIVGAEEGRYVGNNS